jgi:hypothetical protein
MLGLAVVFPVVVMSAVMLTTVSMMAVSLMSMVFKVLINLFFLGTEVHDRD